MADLISDLAAKAGISRDMAGKGVGAILELCRNKLPAEAYSKLSAAVPGAAGLIATAVSSAACPDPSARTATAAAATRPSPRPGTPTGGVTGTFPGMFGKALGGGGAGKLAGKLSDIGFSPQQLEAFLPAVLEFLKDKVPANNLRDIVDGTVPLM
jgi:hypothetical protein